MSDNNVVDFVGDEYEEPKQLEIPDPIDHTIKCYGEEFIVQVIKRPDTNCKKCHGRGHRGLRTTTRGKSPVLCSCVLSD